MIWTGPALVVLLGVVVRVAMGGARDALILLFVVLMAIGVREGMREVGGRNERRMGGD